MLLGGVGPKLGNHQNTQGNLDGRVVAPMPF